MEAGNKSKQKQQALAETDNVREPARRPMRESIQSGIGGKHRKEG